MRFSWSVLILFFGLLASDVQAQVVETSGLRWKCDAPGIELHLAISGARPYEVQVDDLSLDEALAGLKCLDAVFARNPPNPDVPDLRSEGRVAALRSGPPERGRPFVAYAEARNECYWFEYPRQCRADGAEPVPVIVTSGCVSE
ncbi:MAG TPA: hypothetical protein VGO61_07345 [Steroidobacteraceae bacterium]|jgi:hypothetical protein|nr:hypothetical protein [Steroidobacteraceae bacterium]